MTAEGPVLVLTVGGSPQPLKSAIRTAEPCFVAFVCSDASGRRADGSPSPSSVPEAHAIAAELGLEPTEFEVHEVPPDDPDVAGPLAAAIVDALCRRFPAARLRLDYTGGTKTMSAALMLAGIREPGARVELQIMKGAREDLNHVTDGTERPVRLAVDALLAARTLDVADRFWQRFGYAEAEALLAGPAEDLEHAETVPLALRQRLRRAHALSHLFAAWDRFDHPTALHVAGAWGEGPPLDAARLRTLRSLATERRATPLLVLDLWRNAERRAARGQFEDAVARCYRATEATAQWLLHEHVGIETGDVDLAKVPADLHRRIVKHGSPKGKLQIPLTAAWDLLSGWAERADAPAAFRHVKAVLRQPVPALRMRPARLAMDDRKEGWTARRNASILAHGFDPVGPDEWRQVESWMRHVLIDGIFPGAGLAPATLLPQLPDRALWTSSP